MLYLDKGVINIPVKPDGIFHFLNMVMVTYICLLIC